MDHPNVKYLYKYKPINQFTLDIISNDRIFFPSPDLFNDPFDTKCSFTKTSVIAQSTDSQKIEMDFPGDDLNQTMIFTRKDMSIDIERFEQKLKSFGILSLAQDPKNILMWSHYAENHKGLCIGFERNKSNELGDNNKTRKVNYTKNYPSLNVKILMNEVDITNNLMRVLYTKSKLWDYEGEWRMFTPIGNKAYPLPGKIKSITFGSRTPSMDIDIIKKLINGTDIKLYQASLKENLFGIKSYRI